MLVCLDTSLLILTQQTRPSPGQEDLYKQAQAYEEWLSEGDAGILIPTPVIAEYLCSRDASERRQVIASLQRYADIGDFDLRAAELAARIRLSYQEKFGLPKGWARQGLSIDMMIAAIAIVNRASHIVTHDIEDFEKILSVVEFKVHIRGVLQGPPGQGKLL